MAKERDPWIVARFARFIVEWIAAAISGARSGTEGAVFWVPFISAGAIVLGAKRWGDTMNEAVPTVAFWVFCGLAVLRFLLAPFWMIEEANRERDQARRELGEAVDRAKALEDDTRLREARALETHAEELARVLRQDRSSRQFHDQQRRHRDDMSAHAREIEERAREGMARRVREYRLRRLGELRDAGHQMLNFLDDHTEPVSAETKRQAVQWFRDEVVSLAEALAPGRGTVIDSAYIEGWRGKFRNESPGVCPDQEPFISYYLESLLQRLERFLGDA